MLIRQVVVANLLKSYQSTVTVVTKTPPTSTDIDGGEEVEAGDGSEWEALVLKLSREDISSDTELEDLIVRDLVVRHQKFMS